MTEVNSASKSVGSKFTDSVVRKEPAGVDNFKSEASRTGNELLELRNSKVSSSRVTATGQPLTPYHSLLYSLLSWEQPRATAVSYASVVTVIFAVRFLPLLRWIFKFLYLALGFTAATEVAGRFVLSQSVVKSFRPRKYYTVPRETVEAVLEDIEQLLDFFLLEFQRILFAEDVSHTVAAFFAAFVSYGLIKFLPLWGVSLIGATAVYIGPLVYINNRELIDAQVENAQEALNDQVNQVKGLASQRTNQATDLMKQRFGDYSNKAQEYISHRRSASATPEMAKVPSPVKKEPEAEVTSPEPAIKTEDFPLAPKAEPAVSVEEPKQEATTSEPLLA